MQEIKPDYKGIFSFLGITFALTYAVEILLIMRGFRITQLPALYGQMVIAVVMWAPALATVMTIKLITHEGFAVTNLRFGSWKPYLISGLVVPGCFVIIYGATWALGLSRPDWKLQQFAELIAPASDAGRPSMPPTIVWAPALFLATLTISPLVNGLLGLGEELGWRGYLLPKLMVLGKPKAYSILGVIWGLWHLPLIVIGFAYPGHPLLGVPVFMALTIALGIYLNELTLRHRSSVLAGWVHGVFNSQKLGIWTLLFPGVNPLIGGYAGVVGIVVWLFLGVWEMKRHMRS